MEDQTNKLFTTVTKILDETEKMLESLEQDEYTSKFFAYETVICMMKTNLALTKEVYDETIQSKIDYMREYHDWSDDEELDENTIYFDLEHLNTIASDENNPILSHSEIEEGDVLLSKQETMNIMKDVLKTSQTHTDYDSVHEGQTEENRPTEDRKLTRTRHSQ